MRRGLTPVRIRRVDYTSVATNLQTGMAFCICRVAVAAAGYVWVWWFGFIFKFHVRCFCCQVHGFCGRHIRTVL